MQEKKYSIKDWAKDDRPREKLLSAGPAYLSTSELLALLIQNGTPEKPVMEVAKEVLRTGKNSLQELGKLSVMELSRLDGIGKIKAMMLVAALELGRRMQVSEPTAQPPVSSSSDIARWLQARLCHYEHELFAVLFLNRGNRIKHFEIISQGGITGTVADPRIILKRALEHSAVNLVLSHNHPSGNIRPSRSDELITQRIKQAAALLDIRVLDHIIISSEGYYSFAEEGQL